jgi:hypothetical protein
MRCRREVCFKEQPACHDGYGSVIGGFAMKKISLITALASVAAAAVLFSTPAAAEVERVQHDLKPYFGEDRMVNSDTPSTPTMGVPEPGTVALLVLGLGSLGFVALRRRRVQP